MQLFSINPVSLSLMLHHSLSRLATVLRIGKAKSESAGVQSHPATYILLSLSAYDSPNATMPLAAMPTRKVFPSSWSAYALQKTLPRCIAADFSITRPFGLGCVGRLTNGCSMLHPLLEEINSTCRLKSCSIRVVVHFCSSHNSIDTSYTYIQKSNRTTT